MDVFSYKGITIYRSVFPPLNSNMFVLFSDKEAVVFDPNVDETLLRLLENRGIGYVHILLTHGHYDHISGVLWLKEHIAADIYCQKRCADRLANSKRPLSRLVAMVLAMEDKKDGGHRYQDFKESYIPFTIQADKTFDKEDNFTIGNLCFHVTSTPGHSEGSACYELNGVMVFTGDTLLQNDEAITRFPSGNTVDYETQVLPYLKNLEKSMQVFPGHGDPFKISESKY